jgi:DNA repair protein RadA/Sms
MSVTGKRRGRPAKKVNNSNVAFTVTTVKMDDFKFNENLFKPMRTKTKIDEIFSSERGLMPGTNLVFTGDPGVGKTTVLLDVISDLHENGKKVLFVSAEMNAIDMVGYARRYPKFGSLDILFMGDYSEVNPDVVLRTVLRKGYDVVLVDSMAEVADSYTEFYGGTNKSNQAKLLQLFEEHNLGNNESKINTTFLIIQQVTKGGLFVGSNKLKHLTTGMFHMKFSEEGRYIYFSKNRRGGNANRFYFSLMNQGRVEYLHDTPNMDLN